MGSLSHSPLPFSSHLQHHHPSPKLLIHRFGPNNLVGLASPAHSLPPQQTLNHPSECTCHQLGELTGNPHRLWKNGICFGRLGLFWVGISMTLGTPHPVEKTADGRRQNRTLKSPCRAEPHLPALRKHWSTAKASMYQWLSVVMHLPPGVIWQSLETFLVPTSRVDGVVPASSELRPVGC